MRHALLSAAVAALTLVACSRAPAPSAVAPTGPTAAAPTVASTPPAAAPAATLDLEVVRKAALEVVAALKARDTATVARYAHPTQGVRFSPYAFVDPKTDQVWKAEELAGWFADTQTRVWGTEDGTGFDIERTPTAYYERFVFPKDFTTGATVSVNDDQARGNSINNAAQVYPDGVRVEFYLPPTQTPEGPNIDWRALRLVFVDVAGQPKLVAVIHDQWTI
jgi:hypothetical protein